MFPQAQRDGTYRFNGKTYETAHEAIRAYTAARNAEPVVTTPKSETDGQRRRRERREARGEIR